MGEVYRAKDTRLKREAAIKVLPVEFSEDDDRLKRFERKARAASALNHPNIITIYDIASSDSHTYIAMELVDGKTLRQMLNSGPLPLRKSLSIAAQLADGLAKAHSGGIVHRDLKPENLMITKEGFAKILDFGLAKLALPGSKEASGALTRSDTQTQAGTLLGTVAYMSPEQAAGQSVDFRSDQFSFGTILYEMITGKHPFRRKTAAETLSAILNEEPEAVSTLSAQTPTPVTWIIERCMAKDPADRYESTRDLAKDIHTLRDHFSRAGTSAESLGVLPGPIARRKKLQKIWNIAAAALLVFLTASLFFVGKNADKTQSSALSYHRLTYRRGIVNSARFAPDGHTIIYSGAFQGNPRELFLTRTEGVESRTLGLPDANVLSISPSGQMAILLHPDGDGTLAEVPLAGGAPREMMDNVVDATWGPDGSTLAVVRDVSEGTRLEYPPGRLLYETSGYIEQPRFSPKGDLIAFSESVGRNICNGHVVILDLSGKKLMASGEECIQGIAWSPASNEVRAACWSESGSGTQLNAFTVEGRKRVIQRFPGMVALQDVDAAGRLLLDFRDSRATVGLLNGGELERDLSWLDVSKLADLSADGKTILIWEGGEGSEIPLGTIYIRKTDGSPAARIGAGYPVAFSRDGKLAFGFQRDPWRWILLPVGAGEAKSWPIEPSGRLHIGFEGPNLFPNGRQILFMTEEAGPAGRVYLQNVGGGKPRPITPEGVIPFENTISSDGKFFVGTGADQKIYLYPIDGGQPRLLSGIQSGEEPMQWNKDGVSIYVRNTERLPTSIYRVNTLNGQRTLVKKLMPSDPICVNRIDRVRLTPDEKTFVYSYHRMLSTLYLISGLK